MQPNADDVRMYPDDYKAQDPVYLPGEYTFVIPSEEEQATMPSKDELASLKKDDQVSIVLTSSKEATEAVSLVLIDVRDELWDGFVVSSSSNRDFVADVPPYLWIRFNPDHIRSFERREDLKSQ